MGTVAPTRRRLGRWGREGSGREGETVILTGRVRSWAEKQEAERVAWSAPGVVSVDNRIVVG